MQLTIFLLALYCVISRWSKIVALRTVKARRKAFQRPDCLWRSTRRSKECRFSGHEYRLEHINIVRMAVENGGKPKEICRTAPRPECHFVCVAVQGENRKGSDWDYWGLLRYTVDFRYGTRFGRAFSHKGPGVNHGVSSTEVYSLSRVEECAYYHHVASTATHHARGRICEDLLKYR